MPVILFLLLAMCFPVLGYCQTSAQRAVPSRFCQRLGCSQGCHITGTGNVVCACMLGFKIQSDGSSCQDRDECTESPNYCQHGCNNTVGSFICTCEPGYSLRDDGRTCREFSDYSEAPCGSNGDSKIPCIPNSGGNRVSKFGTSKTDMFGLSNPHTRQREEKNPFAGPNHVECGESKCKQQTDLAQTGGVQVTSTEAHHDTITDTVNRDDKTTEKITSYTDTSESVDIYDVAEEDFDKGGNLPPCLGGECKLGNIDGILTDCTGSGCPPKDKKWYEQFLGIPIPDHNYFERKKRDRIKTALPIEGKQSEIYHRQDSFSHKSNDRRNMVQAFGPNFPPIKAPPKKAASKVQHLSQMKFKTDKRSQSYIKENYNSRDGGLVSDDPKCRDDLCIDTDDEDRNINEIDPIVYPNAKEFDCPQGYLRESRGQDVFCTPQKVNSITDLSSESRCNAGEQLVRTNGRELCIPTKTKAFQRIVCPKGEIPMKTEKGLECVNLRHKDNVICQEGQVAIETKDGKICIHPNSEPEKIPALENRCRNGQVAIQTVAGFVCVEEVEPRPMCSSGTVPQTVNGRLECVSVSGCPPGQVAISTETGTVCRVVTTSPSYETTTAAVVTSERPCPYGLVPLQTPVGRVCQYMPPKLSNRKRSCPTGMQIKNIGGVLECAYNHQSDHRECPDGQILIKTDDGDVCGIDVSAKQNCPNGIKDKSGKCISFTSTECPEGQVPVKGNSGTKCVSKVNPCPFGFVKIDGQCQNLNMDNLCPVGQHLVETPSGFDCVYKHHENPAHGTKIECGHGQILSQAMRSFYCETLDVPVSETRSCSSDFIFTKVGGGYACITEFEASLQCPETEVLIRLPDGFTCISMKRSAKKQHEPQCGPHEVALTNEKGLRLCVSLDSASTACGEGYKAVKLDSQFVCRKERINLRCQEGFALSFDGETPACVSEIDLDCIPTNGQITPECLSKVAKTPLPPCDDGYQLAEVEGMFECGLVHSNEEGCTDRDCREVNCKTDHPRPCDINPEILLAGCNPDCANGGTCNNGTCVCPSGIAGKACNNDVNECLLLRNDACEYECENTFGSYQCICPPGLTLHTDRRTCKAKYCVPDCLNGGICISGRCQCPRGFTGDFCQTDIDECGLYGERLCQHICRNTWGSYSCICPTGTTLNPDGRTCTNTTCIPQCRNGGHCENNRCVCPPGFYGIVCQLDVNECYKYSPCSHSCVNLRGSYRCTCPPGYRLQTDAHTCY